jgi:hypothetical protein
MIPKLSFKSVQTPYGLLHTLRVEGGSAPQTGSQGPVEYHLYPSRPVDEYIRWEGPTLLAENRTAWRIGLNVSGGRIAWKS